jgi:hypothetical protein
MNRVTDKFRMKGRFLIALAPMLLASTLAVAMIGLATPASAQVSTGVTTIAELRTGWNADSFAVITAAPIGNPAGCSTPDGYISAKSFLGYQTYYEAVLKAFGGINNIVITVDSSRCFAGRPLLIGINICRSSAVCS